jgi:hypothetical protein
LKHADFVLADVSLQNGNVYYELGIRHVAQEKHCVQVAAQWFKPLFDIQQFRTITYPLKNGDVPDDEASAIRALLKAKIPGYRDAKTPYHDTVSESAGAAFEDEARRMSEFQAELSEVRLLPPGDRRKQRVQEVAQKHADAANMLPGIALELLALVRDTQSWEAVRDFVAALPESTRNVETIQEQYFLALSKLGDNEKAIAGILELNKRCGPTPERCGIVGGRYKTLYKEARKRREASGAQAMAADERQYLKKAIESYEQGMLLDLNEYYCACNLPALLRDQARRGDEDRAKAIDVQVVAACRRAKQLGNKDPWLNATLFGTAFRLGDVTALEDIADEIENGVAWQLGTTLADADVWIRQAPAELKDALGQVLDRLRARS